MVTASLGKGEVESSILSCSTIIFPNENNGLECHRDGDDFRPSGFNEPNGMDFRATPASFGPGQRRESDGDVGSISLRFALVAAGAFVAFIAAWQLAVFQFPETMHQVRLGLLLLATGGPDE